MTSKSNRKNSINELLEGYREKIEHYQKELYPHFENHCNTKRKEYSAFIIPLLQLYFFSSFLIDDFKIKNKRKIKKNYYQSFYILFCKSSQALLSTKACLDSGCLSDALMILRGHFENFITLKMLIQKNPYKRARLYWNYSHVDQYMNYLNNIELLRSGKINKAVFNRLFDKTKIKTIKRNFNKVKRDYRYKRKKKWEISFKWYYKLYGNISLKQVCKNPEINESYSYIKTYGPLSMSVHSNKLIENLLTQKGNYTLAPNYSEMIISIAYMAMDFHIKVIEMVLEFFKIKERKDMILFINSFLLAVYERGNTKNKYKYFSRFLQIING